MAARAGFTLIELMIVVAIIAIIAAIAIPGLLSSQRASNERNAAASLKTLASAQADFRGNDRDGNKIQDFWTRDVAGLYGVLPVASTEPVRLIEVSVAGADFNARGNSAIGTTGLRELRMTNYAISAPKAGYWYRIMTTDETGADYRQDTDGVQDSVGTLSNSVVFNFSKFAFQAFPGTFSMGRSCFFLNEGNTLFKRPTNGSVTLPATTPPSAAALITGPTALIGAQVAETWPSDVVLRVEYAKLD